MSIQYTFYLISSILNHATVQKCPFYFYFYIYRSLLYEFKKQNWYITKKIKKVKLTRTRKGKGLYVRINIM